MPNLGQIISRNNKRKLDEFKQQNEQNQRTCDCRDEPCPVEGSCLTPETIYQATVTRTDNGQYEKYVGLSGGPFKSRYRVHKGNMRNRHEGGTKLSKYVWSLKDDNINFEIKWKYIAKANAYTPAAGRCNLCIKEIYIILFKKEESSLNERTDIFNPCLHRRKFKLYKN